MEYQDRQQIVWTLAKLLLSPQEMLGISMFVTLSPAESASLRF